MADVTVWDILTAAGATGSFAVLCLLAARIWSGLPNFMDRWLALKAARAAEKAADWSRLRDLCHDHGEEITRLNSRCDFLQAEVDECRQREAEWMHRAIKAEAASEGMGEARNTAQRIVSAEMQAMKPKDKPNE